MTTQTHTIATTATADDAWSIDDICTSAGVERCTLRIEADGFYRIDCAANWQQLSALVSALGQAGLLD